MDDKNILRKTALEDKVARDGDKPEAWSSYFFSQHGSHFKSMILDAAGEAWNDSQHNSVDGISQLWNAKSDSFCKPLLPLLERGTHEETGGVAEEAFRGEQEESRRNYLNTTPPDSS
jgi:hypothetical protein